MNPQIFSDNGSCICEKDLKLEPWAAYAAEWEGDHIRRVKWNHKGHLKWKWQFLQTRVGGGGSHYLC